MIIGGLQKLSLIDYPEHLSAIVFTRGCNFRCHYCYNPMLVLPQGGRKNKQEDLPSISEADLLAFLSKRQNKLEAVVVTGGEPTMHADLPELIAKIKALGFLVKLDTNGTNPAMLGDLIASKMLDYIAMDYKAPLDRYQDIINIKTNLDNLKKSVKIIIDSGLPYEFRTTVAPSLLNAEDIKIMAQELVGAKLWYLQKLESDKKMVDEAFEQTRAYMDKEMESLAQAGREFILNCIYRQY